MVNTPAAAGPISIFGICPSPGLEMVKASFTGDLPSISTRMPLPLIARWPLAAHDQAVQQISHGSAYLLVRQHTVGWLRVDFSPDDLFQPAPCQTGKVQVKARLRPCQE